MRTYIKLLIGVLVFVGLTGGTYLFLGLIVKDREAEIASTHVLPVSATFVNENPREINEDGPYYFVTAVEFVKEVTSDQVYSWLEEDKKVLNEFLIEENETNFTVTQHYAGWSESRQGYLLLTQEQNLEAPPRRNYLRSWEITKLTIDEEGKVVANMKQLSYEVKIVVIAIMFLFLSFIIAGWYDSNE